MRLTDLNPRWVGAGGEGIREPGPDPCQHCTDATRAACRECHGTGQQYVQARERHGIGISFDCPCGCDDRAFVAFKQPLDGGPPIDGDRHTWDRTGDTFEALQLRPSIQRIGGCGWHGFVGLNAPGDVSTC